jgi:hypothetical protein
MWSTVGFLLIGGFHHDLVDVAPDPILPGLEGLDQRMLRGVEVFGSMFVLGAVATSNVAAAHALAQVHPRVARLEALLTALGAWLYVLYLIQVRTPSS